MQEGLCLLSYIFSCFSDWSLYLFIASDDCVLTNKKCSPGIDHVLLALFTNVKDKMLTLLFVSNSLIVDSFFLENVIIYSVQEVIFHFMYHKILLTEPN